ncbi:hypothetical protein [Streptomyces sp. NBC_01716]|nr:hypothetical protein [Streptomyces sp. NBC_01716]
MNMRGQEGVPRGGVSVPLAGVLREEPEDQIFEVQWDVVAE